VVPEIFGLTDHLQELCRGFAEEGFIALAPDLYHSFAKRVMPYEEVAAARALRGKLSDQQVVDYLEAAFRLLAARGEVRSGLVGAIGFGSGGRDAFLLATRDPEVLALVCYYGPIARDEPNAPIKAAGRLQAPALLFFGEADQVIPNEQVDAVREALDALGKDYEMVTYPDAGHGFFNPDMARHNPEAAADSWNRTIDFLYERLEG
jgi:carboxymethylenebutenolidase